jgi:hypothetical protein
MAIGIGQKSYPFNYNAIVSIVPRQAGWYALFNANWWFYLGESDHLAAGLLQFLMDRQTTINAEQPSTFQFEVVSGDDQRKALMNQLSRNFQASGPR